MKKFLAAVSLAAASGLAVAQTYTPPASSASSGVEYLQDNAVPGIIAVGGIMMILSGVAVAVKWLKATFFG